MGVSDIIALYMKMAPSRAIYTEVLSKDWHDFMDKSHRWTYTIRGIALTLVEGRDGNIPRHHL